MKIKGFIFDFDGVIADTESIWFKTLVSFAESEKLDTDENTMAAFVGDGDTSVMDHLASKIGGRQLLNEKLPAVKQRFREKTSNLEVRDGLNKYLDYADKNGILLAVASSSSQEYIDNWLVRLGISHRFNTVVTRNDVSRIKPYPDIYQKALDQLHLSAYEALAFEDSVIGCRSAEAAGVFCVIVPNLASRIATSKLPNLKLNMAKTPPVTFLHNLNNYRKEHQQ